MSNPPHPPALSVLLDRISVPARLLGAPGPGREELELAVAAALRAPDHGGLRPWRFVIVTGDARRRLGEVMATALAARDPAAPPERLEIERAKPMRSPVVVAVAAALRPEARIPVWEQQASAAAGVMNFINALEAQGHGAIWLSSATLGDPALKQALGFAETDMLLGWVYAGTRQEAAAPRPRPEVSAHLRDWQG